MLLNEEEPCEKKVRLRKQREHRRYREEQVLDKIVDAVPEGAPVGLPVQPSPPVPSQMDDANNHYVQNLVATLRVVMIAQ